MKVKLKAKEEGGPLDNWTWDKLHGISVYVMNWTMFLSDPGVPGVRSMCLDVRPSVRPSVTRLFADLTDVTLADEDSNSRLTDDVNKAILGNVAMEVAPSGGQH